MAKNLLEKNETMDSVVLDFLDFWKFEKMPFPKIVAPENVYQDPKITEKINKLKQVLVTGEIGVVCGEAGTGKSTLLASFLDQISVTKFRKIEIFHPQPKPRELFRAIAQQMGVDTTLYGADSMKVCNLFIQSYQESNRSSLLLIDESHVLSIQALNELRLLTNMSIKHQPILTLILFGQPVLSATLKSPDMIPFVQRIGVWIPMGNFNIAQTIKYIHWQLTSAGYKGDEIFPEITTKAIFRKTFGVPRIVNRLCIECLHEAAIKNVKVVSEDLFIQVCKNLGPHID